ncbi:MAG: succinylglutamate desuccinylase [Alphaproteobacteria bacterium]|nr:succinylglutamate desuccinylase/aspartoacylase family protein [Alphaproteobacteria bacterium]TAD90834.1 MAG: succinylglutamate desuccinylase [Alphaproteobacteria bacterium]
MSHPYPVTLLPPDITAFREGTVGIPYVHSFAATAPGPAVMVMALTHGNELCGAHAVKKALDMALRPRRGTLTFAFANVAAFDRFDPADPDATRFVDEDGNRVWGAKLDSSATSTELERARQLRPIVEAQDLVLDIHSMQHPTAPLMLSGWTAKGRALAQRVGVPATIVADRGHAAGTRMIDHGAFADETAPQTALLVECGQHWDPASVVVAEETMWRFLATSGLFDAGDLPALPPPPPQTLIEVTEAVTVRTERFTFTQPFIGLERIAKQGDLIGMDGDTPVTAPYDECVLIMPSRRLRVGQTAVRLGRILG